MKYLLLAIVLNIGSAYACPDLSGEYAFENEWNGKIVIEQTGCESVVIKHSIPTEGKTRNDKVYSTFTQDLKADGLRYDGSLYSRQLASETSSIFNITQFTGNRLVHRNFHGDPRICDGKYSFQSFECQQFEFTYGYDDDLKTFTKTQVGFWRNGDGQYGNDVFKMRKVR